MKKMIKSIHIEKFRGVQNLKIENLNIINIFVGDNNVGKTSILESIRVLGSASLSNLVKIANSRCNNGYFMSFENFIYLFPKLDKEAVIHINADFYDQNYIDFKLSGKIENILFDFNDLPDYEKRRINERESNSSIINFDSEIKQFNGLLNVKSSFLEKPLLNDITFNYYSKITGLVVDRSKSFLKISYLSPLSYLSNDTFSEIIRNDIYKEICIKIIHLFDEDIIDLVILKDKNSNIHTEYLKSNKKGLMPLNTYGDGIKKVLAIANGIAKANSGILLIDEIENAIHAKYYDDIFSFIVKAAKMFNVQLFITTHSIEAMDGLLSTQSYENKDEDIISVITLRKDSESNATLSRTMSGKEVKTNREKFNFEVRI